MQMLLPTTLVRGISICCDIADVDPLRLAMASDENR
jgi:hypothetical protein